MVTKLAIVGFLEFDRLSLLLTFVYAYKKTMSKLPSHLKAINIAIIVGIFIFAAIIDIKIGFMHEAYPVYLIFMITFVANPLAMCSLLRYTDEISESEKEIIIKKYMLAITAFSMLALLLILLPLTLTPQSESITIFPSVMCLLTSYALMMTSYITMKKMVMAKNDEYDEYVE